MTNFNIETLLEQIKSSSETSQTDEDLYQKEKKDVEKRQEDEFSAIAIQMFQKVTENMENDINLRKDFSEKIFNLVKHWLMGLALLLFLVGTGQFTKRFVLPDNVVFSLATTTTATILGMLTFVAKYLFQNKNQIDHNAALDKVVAQIKKRM